MPVERASIRPWPALLDRDTVGEYFGVSGRLVSSWENSVADFPQAVELPAGRLRKWRRTDLDDWVEKLGNKQTTMVISKMKAI